ncbi:MAG: hypothetical protein RIQ94_1430 [Pseudomonadota bacterium]|jgi:streptomycin 6-kinase
MAQFCWPLTKLDHYWILHRFNEAKDIIIIGEPIMPYEMPHPNYGINAATLTTRLNDNDAFDIAIKFEEKDQLEIVFNNLTKDPLKILTYHFKYTNGKWFEEDNDPFDLMNHYDDLSLANLRT